MKCNRCGAEDSMFWYPYAFGVAPFPDPVSGRIYDNAQRFMLCDRCQEQFVDFMRNKRWPWFDSEKLKEAMDSEPLPFVQEAKE